MYGIKFNVKKQLGCLLFLLMITSILFCGQVTANEEDFAFLEEDGVVIIEIESVPLAGAWAFETDLKGYTGEGYYTWKGPNLFRTPGHGVLTYKIYVTNPGQYNLFIYNRHDFHDRTENNDVWVRVNDGRWIKTYSSINREWTWHTRYEFSHGNRGPAVNELKEGLNIIQLSGRSTDFSISRMVFCQVVSQGQDLSREESPRVKLSDLKEGLIPAAEDVSTLSSSISAVSELKKPFTGEPVTLPGTIMAVEYDLGGQDVSYYDTISENRGAQMRGVEFRADESVDVDNHPDGGYVIGWIAAGEWVEYTVNVAKAGEYELEFHTGSLNGGGSIGISVDGETLLSGIAVPQTHDWHSYTTFTERVNLDAGEQVWRVNMENSGFNLYKIVVK